MSLGFTWMQIPEQRRKRLTLVFIAAIISGAILWAGRNVILPFLIGLFLVYLLYPIARQFETWMRRLRSRRGLSWLAKAARPLSIVITYLLLIALIAGFFAILVPVISDQSKALWDEKDAVLNYLSNLLENIVQQYHLLPPTLRSRLDVQLNQWDTKFGDLGQEALNLLGNILQQAVEGTAWVISYTFSLALAVVMIPFWAFYLLLDSEELAASTVHLIPTTIREDVLKIATITDSIFGAYLRGQLLLGLLMGLVSILTFTLLGVNFAVLLGVIMGIFKMIPSIGPIIGTIPALLVALVQDPSLALWVGVYALAVEQVENFLISPHVMGHSVRLHPAIVMIVLVLGSELNGVLGLFFAPVVTAILRDVFRYLYYRTSTPPTVPDEALQRVWRAEPFDMRL